MKLAESEAETKFASRAELLEAAGLLRSVVASGQEAGRFRYFTLSGAGISELR